MSRIVTGAYASERPSVVMIADPPAVGGAGRGFGRQQGIEKEREVLPGQCGPDGTFGPHTMQIAGEAWPSKPNHSAIIAPISGS